MGRMEILGVLEIQMRWRSRRDVVVVGDTTSKATKGHRRRALMERVSRENGMICDYDFMEHLGFMTDSPGARIQSYFYIKLHKDRGYLEGLFTELGNSMEL
jgi:hypothetical protein